MSPFCLLKGFQFKSDTVRTGSIIFVYGYCAIANTVIRVSMVI